MTYRFEVDSTINDLLMMTNDVLMKIKQQSMEGSL